MSVSVNDFWNRVSDSGLADAQQCRQLAVHYAKQNGGPPGSAKQLAKWLIGTKQMTLFQARNLLSGDDAPLVIGDLAITGPCDTPPFSRWFNADLRSDADSPRCLVFLPESGESIHRRTLWRYRNLSSPNVLTIDPAEASRGENTIVARLPDGVTLRQLIDEGPIPADQVSQIGQSLAAGLAALHSAGIVCGNVHPARVWIPKRGNAMLLCDPSLRPESPFDALSSGSLDPLQPDLPASAFGAPEFSIPGKKPDAATDIYALGCVLYYARFGEPPFPAADPDQMIHQHATSVPEKLTHVRDGDHRDSLRRVIAHLMAKNRTARIPSAAAAVGLFPLIGKPASVQPVQTPPPVPQSPTSPPKPERRSPPVSPPAAGIGDPDKSARSTVAAGGSTPSAPVPPKAKPPAKASEIEKPESPSRPPTPVAPPSPVSDSPQAAPPPVTPPPAPIAAVAAPVDSTPSIAEPQPVVSPPPSPTVVGPAATAAPLPPADLATQSPSPVAATPPPPADTPPTGQAPDGDPPKKRRSRPAGSRGKKKKKKKAAVLVIGGVGFSMLTLLIAVLVMNSGGKRRDPDPEPVPIPIATKVNPRTGTVTSTSSGPEMSPSGKFQLVDDRFSLWLPPDESTPPPLSMIPPGPQMIVVLRPATLIGSESGRKVLAALENEVSPGFKAIEKRIGVSLGEVERLILAIEADEAQQIQAAISVELTGTKSLGALRSAWGDPDEAMVADKQTLFAGDALGADAFYVKEQPPNDSLPIKHFAVGSVKQIQMVAEMGGGEIPMGRQLESAWSKVRSDATFTVVVYPNFLFADGKQLLGDYAPAIMPKLRTDILADASVAMFTMQFDPDWYGELRLVPGGGSSAAALKQQLSVELSELQSYAYDFQANSSPHPSWRELAVRLPRMLEALESQTRTMVDDSQAAANFYLPEIAAPNLILGSWMAINTPAGTVAMAAAPTATAKPWTVEEMIDRPISVAFDQEPLHFAGKTVVDEINNARPKGSPELKVVIIGNDLQKMGITQNQQIRDFKTDNMKVRDAMTKLVQQANIVKGLTDPSDPKQALIWLLGPNPENANEKVIIVTTRDGAAAAGYTLMPEFVTK